MSTTPPFDTSELAPAGDWSSLCAGYVVAGYVLRRRVGEGGMGEVWEATTTGGERVALKFIKEVSPDLKRRRRFLREVRAAMALDHPSVVKVRDVVEAENGAPVMVMELLEGESLGELFRRDRQLDLAEVAEIMLPVVSAVGGAHALGVVHRDLKPENIFLARRSGGGVDVRVLDFGLAKLALRSEDGSDPGGLTTTGAILGTPCYMAPEQVFAEADVDHRADIWAIGLILYQAFTGILPTQADNVGQILKNILTRPVWPLEEAAPELPGEVSALVNRMLDRDRSKRPASLAELYTVLRRYTDVAVPSIREPAVPATGHAPEPLSFAASPDPVVPPRRSASHAIVLAVTAAALVLAGALAWRVTRTHHSPSGSEAEGPTSNPSAVDLAVETRPDVVGDVTATRPAGTANAGAAIPSADAAPSGPRPAIAPPVTASPPPPPAVAPPATGEARTVGGVVTDSPY
jgi:serine/threonine-protein kinase